MADEGSTDQTGGANLATGSQGTSPGVPRAAWVPWERFEATLLGGVDPNVEIDLALPPLSFRGIAGIRQLLQQALLVDPARDVLVRRNEHGRIVSLRLPIRRAWSDVSPAGPPPSWVGVVPGGDSPRQAEKAGADGKRGGWRWIAQIGVFIGVLTAFLTFLGLLWQRFPDWGPEVPPPDLAVAVSEVELEERVPQANAPNYLVVAYDVSFTGYREDRIHVEWAAFDARTQARVRLAPSVSMSDENPGNAVAGDVEADAQTDRGRGRIEFAAPGLGECIFVRVYAYDTDYNRLDYGDTAPFHRRDAAQGCAALTATAEAVASSDGPGRREDSEP